MLYYKKINIVYYDEIINHSLHYVKQQTEIFNRERPLASFYEMQLEGFLTAVPEVELAFKNLGLKCIRAAVYVMYKTEHTAIHKDCLWPMARINLPLLNCENTYTRFYKNAVTGVSKNPQTGIVSYPVINKDYELVDTVELTQPTILKVSEAHDVQLDDTPVPRIALTLGFTPNPIFLLNENNVI
jgi:hypothetical protein